MLTSEQNELLTQTGPGTPAGQLLRCYWQPAALTEELPTGGSPLPIRLLGEELVLFRDESGSPGLLGLHCSHRGADLSYGRLEDGGIRCIYHGWLYDIYGRCLEQPGEPAASAFPEKIRHQSYPCREIGGLILAYLGPGDPPLVPAYEFLTAPDDRRRNTKVYRECNYLQGNEGNIDSVHVSFLHRTQPRWSPNLTYDEFEVEQTNYGARNYSIRHAAERHHVHISSFGMPNFSAFHGGLGGNGYSVNWHLPIDDTHHWVYKISFRRELPNNGVLFRSSEDTELGPDYRLARNLSNRYLQDREEQHARTFAGLGSDFYVHDGCAIEGAGPIEDRTKEHLGAGDKFIVAQRSLLFRAIADLEAGRDPVGVIRQPGDNRFDIIVASGEIPLSWDWRAYRKQGLGQTHAVGGS